jgi:hypothetical protein
MTATHVQRNSDANLTRVTAQMPYGWEAFDQGIVERIARRDRRAVDTSEGGSILCPLVGHAGEPLPWLGGLARQGTDWFGDPPIRLHASPTYVLRERLDNFIAGRELVNDALDGTWGKAETHRLGHENSEDAVTWNVFRSLQEAGELRRAVSVLGGFEATLEPKLYLWGRHIGADRTSEWPRLAGARNEIEPWGGQQTEPDCIIHIPGQAWLFVEAKFGSGTATKRDNAAKTAWLDRYDVSCPGVFDRTAISDMEPRHFPEQLLRNVALALRVHQPQERVIVVALTRASDRAAGHTRAQQCLDRSVDAMVRRANWEDIYAALDDQPSLEALKRYFESKSYRLRRAFAV